MNRKQRRNCWDIKQCGREPGGSNAGHRPCPATTAVESAGINGGHNAGRYCWRIAGTYCSDTVDGVFAQKVEDCGQCEVFREILSQEGQDFKL